MACYIKENMIYGIGVDLVKIARIQKAMESWGERFQQKVFTEKERSLCLSKPLPARYWAMRFAAKEAFSKAIGLGMRKGIIWKDIEVSSNSFGKPELLLHGRAKEICLETGIKNSFLTLSDEDGYAIAVVVLEL
jgi:holo-[acyl-carrier protein] synthase